MKEQFRDTAISFEQQADLLARQGMTFGDRARAVRILQDISYTRLKAYMEPFMANRSPRKFKPGTTFEAVMASYDFDRKLRELIFHELEKIEVSIRAHIGYAGMELKDAGYWYLNVDFFKSPRDHNWLLRYISREVQHTDNDAIKYFRTRYSNPLPPCWMVTETLSMGTLYNMYDCMANGPLKEKIARSYGIDSVTLTSWLKHLVYVRNVCAHHARLWNNSLDVGAAVPYKPTKFFPIAQPPKNGQRQKIYMTLCMIKFLQNTIKPTNTFASRLKELLKGVDVSQMGFPSGWESQPFWQDNQEQ